MTWVPHSRCAKVGENIYPFHHVPSKLATAIAAVSVRRMFGPKLTECQPDLTKLESSAEVHPPSGPIAAQIPPDNLAGSPVVIRDSHSD